MIISLLLFTHSGQTFLQPIISGSFSRGQSRKKKRQKKFNKLLNIFALTTSSGDTHAPTLAMILTFFLMTLEKRRKR
jgi:hypothetical protein